LSTIKQPEHGFGRVGQGALVFDTWRAAFVSLFDSLIMDAEEALVQLPYGAIRTQLRRWSAALDAVKKPRLGIIDFDARKVLLDGAEDGEAKLTGLIGFGRAVWGDPLIARWFRERETEEGKELLKGYFGGEREAE